MGQQYCSNCRRITEQLVEGETGRWGSDPSIPLPTVGCMAWEFERLYVCVECSATSSTGRPMRTNFPWLSNAENGERPAAISVTAELEKTMTRPMIVSRAVAPTRR